MKTRSGLLFLLIALFSLSITLTVHGQSACAVDEVLAQPDVLNVERLLPGCRSSLDSIMTATQAALDSAELPADIARLRTILALAHNEAGNDYDARIAIQQALLDWRTAGDALMEGRTLYYLGTFFYKVKQYDQGNAFYSQGANLAQRNGDTFTQGRVKLAYGRRELELENNENALGLLEDTLPLLLANPLIAVPEQIENLTLLSRVYGIFEKYGLRDFYRQQAGFLQSFPNWYTDVVGVVAATACPFETVSDQTDILAVQRGLSSCVIELAGLLDETQTALADATEAAERARLQTLIGLIYAAKGDYYNASLTHERALVSYREVGDRTMEGWTLYYMARAYYNRNQPGNVPTYLGQAQTIATNGNDSFNLGRIRLFQAEYEIEVNNNYGQAALLEEEGLKLLQAAGDTSIPEQIQMLQLLNQTYSVLGDLEKAGQYLRLAQTLRTGGAQQAGDVGSSLVAVNTCQIKNLVNQFDVVYVERQMQLCGNDLAGLMLTAETMVLTAEDPYLQGIAQTYVGMGHYFRHDVLTAYIELDRAVAILRQVGEPRLLGFAYFYIAINEYDKGQSDQAATYYELARTSWERAADNFNLGRVYLRLGLWESDKENYDLAVSYLERALANMQTSTVYSLGEQSTALSRLIYIYREELQNEQRVLEYQQQLDTLYDRTFTDNEPTAVPEVVEGEGTPTEGGGATVVAVCNPREIAAEADLIVAEKILANCPDQWEDLLFQVETARQQASTEEDIAHYQNFLGIVYFYMADYPKAVIEHNRALTRYRTLGDVVNEGRSLFYAGRSYLINKQTGEATSFLSQAQRIGNNSGDPRTVALVALLYGDQAYNSRNMDEALKQYDIAAVQLETLNDVDGMISTMLRLGQIYDERSNYEVALDFYNRVSDLAQEAGDNDHFALAKIGLARYHKYFGRYAQAVADADAALDAASDTVSSVLARIERDDVARYMEDYETARDILSVNPNAYDCVTGDLIRLYTGYYYIAIGQASSALEQFRPLLEPDTCAERQSLMVAHAHAGIADAQLLRRRSDQLVVDAINAAMREYDHLDYPRGYESARIQMANYQFFLRAYDEAERWLSTAERKALDVSDLKAQADIVMLRVEMSIERGQYSNALDNLESASDIYNRLEFAPGLSATLEQRLRIYLDQARYDEAIQLIEFAQENYSTISISFDSRIAYYQGQYYEQIGQTELAVAYYDQALAGFEEAQEILSIVDVQLQKAGILQQRGLYDDAQSLIANLRPVIAEQENNYYLAQIDAALGDNSVLTWHADTSPLSTAPALQDAQAYYQQALANYQLVNNVAGQARVYNSLGELELLKVDVSLNEAKRYTGTNQPIHRALENYRIIGNSLGVANSLYNLGRFALLTFDYEAAQNFLYQALTEVGDNDPLRRASILTALGESYEYRHIAQNLGFGVASNDLYLAVQQYQEATRLLSFAYAEIADKDTQRSFGTQDQTLAPYTKLLRIYAVYTLDGREEDSTEALFYAEQSRARSYLTQLQGEQIDVGGAEESSALTEWQTLRDEVVGLNQLLREVNARSGDDAETENVETEISTRLERMQTLEGELQLSSLQQFVSIQVTDLPTIQAALPDDSMMVVYYVLPAEHTPHGEVAARILSLLITKDSIEKVSQRVEDYQQNVLNQVDAILRSHSPVAEKLLYTLLINPIQNQIAGYSNLVIVPHGILNYVPFEALTDSQNQPMVMSYSMSYVPSATVYTLLRSTVKPADNEGLVLGLGYSGLAQNLPPLTYYSDELLGIEASVPNAELHMDADATESQLTDIGTAEVIHMAAHGRFDSLNPLSSFIALSPGEDSDGLLQVREVYQLSLQEQNPLIVLSACELAISQINPGDELEGMTRAFLLTGARGVIASMWPVDDFITAELMQAFYENRASGMANGEALTAAKRMIHEYYGDTYLWAGFVLIGLES